MRLLSFLTFQNFIFKLHSSKDCFKMLKNIDSNTRLSEINYDEVDKPPDSFRVSCKYLVGLIFSIILYFADLGSDIYISYSYFSTMKYVEFAATLAFVLLSGIIINLISVAMYVEDTEKSGNSRPTYLRITLCILGIPLQSGLLIRYFDSFWYGIKSLKASSQSNKERQKQYFIKMLNEDSDVALLRIFECYLESAPQLILQATLLVKDLNQGQADHQTWQLIVIVLGLIAMGLGMANYNRCIRLDQEDKKNISVLGLAVQFFWHLNFTVSRILSIIAVATLYTFWTIGAVCCHWFAMTVWIAITSKSRFCAKNQILEILFLSVVGMVYIFNFINLNEGSTRRSYLLYYLLCFGENLTAATIWGVNPIFKIKNWVYHIFTILPVFCFLLSVVFLIIYYQFFHPNTTKDCKLKESKSVDKDKRQTKV